MQHSAPTMFSRDAESAADARRSATEALRDALDAMRSTRPGESVGEQRTRLACLQELASPRSNIAASHELVRAAVAARYVLGYIDELGLDQPLGRATRTRIIMRLELAIAELSESSPA